jgi:hypothetical protein
MKDATGKRPIGRRCNAETVQLSALFGAIYFIQGIGEPTEGLIAQPVRSLLKSWGHTTEQITLFAAVVALPWSIKPLCGGNDQIAAAPISGQGHEIGKQPFVRWLARGNNSIAYRMQQPPSYPA